MIAARDLRPVEIDIEQRVGRQVLAAVPIVRDRVLQGIQPLRHLCADMGQIDQRVRAIMLEPPGEKKIAQEIGPDASASIRAQETGIERKD